MCKMKLCFELTLELESEFADELGMDIAHDLLCEMYNGEDTID